MKIDLDEEEKEFLKVLGIDVNKQEDKNDKKKKLKVVSSKLKRNNKK